MILIPTIANVAQTFIILIQTIAYVALTFTICISTWVLILTIFLIPTIACVAQTFTICISSWVHTYLLYVAQACYSIVAAACSRRALVYVSRAALCRGSMLWC